MWGSSFTDLAKKAQELQQQAEAAASRASLVSNSWSSPFSLDSMQKVEDTKETMKQKHQDAIKEQKEQQQHDSSRLVVSQALPMNHRMFSSSSSSNSINSVKSPPPKGKLKVPPSPTGAVIGLENRAVKTSKAKVSQKTDAPGKTSSSSSVNGDNNAANNGTEVTDLHGSQTPSDGNNETDDQAKSLERVETENDDVIETQNSGWSDDHVDIDEKDDDSHVSRDVNVGDDIDNDATGAVELDSNKSIVSQTVQSEDNASNHTQSNDENENKISVQALDEDSSDSRGVPVGLESVDTDAAKDDTDLPPRSGDEAIVDLTKKDDIVTSVTEPTLQAPEAVQSVRMDHDDDPATEDSDDTENAQPKATDLVTLVSENSAPDSRLLVLCSNLSSNAYKKQQNAFTILQASGIRYECIDGSDPAKREWRDELFGISGTTEYPQFFLVDLKTGMTIFWGDYNRFEEANEETGKLAVEISKWQPYATEDDEDANDDVSTGDNAPTEATVEAVPPEALMEQFSQQMRRIEENYQIEIKEIEARHAQQVQQLQAAASHEECKVERDQMEKRMQELIKSKEKEISELKRTNEGHRLKIDVLKREVEGTQKLLEEKDSNLGKANESHFTNLRSIEKQMFEAQNEAKKANKQVSELNEEVAKLRSELQSGTKEKDDITTRSKSLAKELQERRNDCREMSKRIEELQETEKKLETTINDLHSQLTYHGRDKSEKDGELEQLNCKIRELSADLEIAKKATSDAVTKGERSLAEYKKKAQNSLALANSRAAAAVQAKEEAELEARAARTTADTSMDRAVKADIESKRAVAEAKMSLQGLEKQLEVSQSECTRYKKDIEELQMAKSELQNQFDQVTTTCDAYFTDLQQCRADLEGLKFVSDNLNTQLTDKQEVERRLRDEVTSLRSQIRILDEKIFALKQEQTSTNGHKSEASSNGSDGNRDSNMHETIKILQQDLKNANETITELTEALKVAIDQGKATINDSDPTRNGHHPTNGAQQSTPFFYAVEKQAELNTARNEMTRLATLLSNAESEKVEAIDKMTEMKALKEDAEAKLNRYEKLGRAGLVPSQDVGSPRNGDSAGGAQKQQDGSMNIEYLKNIMLSYLNATTLAEKKSLLPVIGAVLCLTPDEQRNAMNNLENGVSIGNVSMSLFESFGLQKK